jgi:hypothetical protein
MRKIPVILCGALIGVFSAASLAGAAPVSRTQVHDVTTVTPDSTNPCTGLTGTQTLTYHLVTQTNIDASGGYHYMVNQNGTVSYVPNDLTQPTYSGKFHYTDNFNGPAPTLGYEYTVVETVHGQFSNGTPGSLQIHEHLTVNANGDITANIDNSLTCSSPA